MDPRESELGKKWLKGRDMGRVQQGQRGAVLLTLEMEWGCRMWAASRKVKKMGPPTEPWLWAQWEPSGFWPTDSKTINLFCLSSHVCGIVLQKPQESYDQLDQSYDQLIDLSHWDTEIRNRCPRQDSVGCKWQDVCWNWLNHDGNSLAHKTKKTTLDHMSGLNQSLWPERKWQPCWLTHVMYSNTSCYGASQSHLGLQMESGILGQREGKVAETHIHDQQRIFQFLFSYSVNLTGTGTWKQGRKKKVYFLMLKHTPSGCSDKTGFHYFLLLSLWFKSSGIQAKSSINKPEKTGCLSRLHLSLFWCSFVCFHSLPANKSEFLSCESLFH